MINRQVNREAVTLNWRRGLSRLWVLVSGAWIMGWLNFFAIELIGGGWTDRCPVTLRHAYQEGQIH